MNKEDLNMDKLFREKLDGFSQQPPSHVWDNIHGRLQEQKRKRRIVLFSRIAAAAVVILAFLAGWYFNEKTGSVVPKTVKSETVNQNSFTKDQKNSNLVSKENNSEKEAINSIQINHTTENQYSEKTGEPNKKKPEQPVIPAEQNSFERIRLAFLDRKTMKMEIGHNIELSVAEISADEFTPGDRVLIAENLKVMEAKNKEENKWKMGLYVSPGYSSQTVDYSESYASNMIYSENNGNSNVSSGFSVQYKTGKKWSVETGVYYEKNGKSSVNLGSLFSKKYDYDNAPMFDTDELYISAAVNSVNGNMMMNSVAGVIEFSETPAGTELMANLDGSSYSTSNVLLADGEYSQVFEFVEIPLYVRYSVLETKFGVEIMGGLNTGIITGNNVYLDNGGSSQNVGKTKDISKINLAGTVGVGFNYALGKHVSLAVEPRFNYYLNSINKNSNVNFKPYRIGIYTGLNYEF